MKKKKKDKSARIAFISSGLVVLLVGASVVSLYSMADIGSDGSISIASASADGSKTAKLYLADTIQLSKKDQEDESAASSSQEAIYTAVQTVETPVIDAVVNDSIVDSEYSVFDEADEGADDELNEADSYVDYEYTEAVWQEDYQESSGEYYEEEYAYYEPEAEYVEPVYVEPAYEEQVYDETDYEEPYMEQDSGDDSTSGDWGYDYDDNVYDDNSSYETIDSTVEETGEWIYDYEIDDWVWEDYSTDSYTDDTYYESDSYDETYEETGEWVYDYDIDDWVWEDYSHDSSNDSFENYDDGWSDNNYYDGNDDGYDEWYDDSSDSEYMDYDDSEDNYSYDSSSYSLGQQIVDYAMGFVGVTPYVWAGSSLYSGTDCSGFVNLIYAAFGIYCSPASLSYDGSSFGYIVSYDQLQPGDIVVYGSGDHVAIYAGNNMVIHCSSPQNGTVYWNMYYRSDISWFLRVTG